MTTKLMTDASLLEAKEQLETIKAQIEASVVTQPSNQFVMKCLHTREPPILAREAINEYTPPPFPPFHMCYSS